MHDHTVVTLNSRSEGNLRLSEEVFHWLKFDKNENKKKYFFFQIKASGMYYLTHENQTSFLRVLNFPRSCV